MLFSDLSLTEASYKAETLGNELKEERGVVKGLKAELQQLKEELFDVKNEKEALDKVGVACPYMGRLFYADLFYSSAIHILTHKHTYTHTYTHTYIHIIHTHTYSHTYIHTHTHTYTIHTHTYIHIHTHTHTHTHTPLGSLREKEEVCLH